MMRGISWTQNCTGAAGFESENVRWTLPSEYRVEAKSESQQEGIGNSEAVLEPKRQRERNHFEGTIEDVHVSSEFGCMVLVLWDGFRTAFWYRAGAWNCEKTKIFFDLFIALGPDPQPNYINPIPGKKQ